MASRSPGLLIVFLATCAAITLPQQALAEGAEAGVRTLAIVYADGLAESAEQWATYRRSPEGGGWTAVLHPVPAVEDVGPADLRRQIQEFLRARYEVHGASQGPDSRNIKNRDPAIAALILGDADMVPTWELPQADPQMRSHNDGGIFVSDHPYQALNTSAIDRPVIALGRVPARNNEQALAVLSKIKAHESATTSAANLSTRLRVNYAAGEGRFGPMDGLLESLFRAMVDRFVPDEFDLTMTYAKASSIYCPPPSQLTQTVLSRMTEGAVLFNYLGHGYATGFDSLHWNGKRLPILRVKDLESLPHDAIAPGHRPVAFLSCCSVGWFDLADGAMSLSEAMLFHPAGPIAIISGSRVTHPYANTVLQKNITRSLLLDRAETVGEMDLRAMQAMLELDAYDRQLDGLTRPIARAGQWKTSLRDLRKMHVKLYNLLGDPATAIDHPCGRIDDLELAENTIRGRIDGMASGRVTITIETRRDQIGQPDALLPLIGSDDPDLERKAAHNFPLVNQRVLQTLEAAVIDGEFAVALADPLPATGSLIRAIAHGQDAQGKALHASGAVRLRGADGKSTVSSPTTSSAE